MSKIIIYFYLEPLNLEIDNEYNLNVIKEITATSSFLSMESNVKQDQKSIDAIKRCVQWFLKSTKTRSCEKEFYCTLRNRIQYRHQYHYFHLLFSLKSLFIFHSKTPSLGFMSL